MTSSRMLTPNEVAAELGVSRATAYRLLPQLRPIKVGSGWRVQRIDLENWIKRNREWHDSLSETESG